MEGPRVFFSAVKMKDDASCRDLADPAQVRGLEVGGIFDFPVAHA